MKKDYSNVEFKENLVDTKSVSKTVKGGRIRRFSALVVVGNGEGLVGYGIGKAAEVPDAIRKAMEAAKRNVIEVPLVGTTIPHEIIGEYGAGKVLLKPAAPGTGIIAGGKVRAVLEMAGIRDIRGKSLRSNNPANVVKATFEALKELRTVEQVAAMRGIDVDIASSSAVMRPSRITKMRSAMVMISGRSEETIKMEVPSSVSLSITR